MEGAKFADNYQEVLRSLKQIYGQRILEAEKRYLFDQFHGQPLRASDFDAKPMVLLLGQYSVGKTSFIEYLLKRPFPGQRIGPEPTTDRYVAVMYGDEEQTIPGNALSVDPDQPFTGTNQFGSNFLNKFEAAKCSAPLLKNIILIDTPGVLSGKKQTLGRAYDFVNVCEWFAGRADMILLLFDNAKLDVSDEFKDVLLCLKGNEDKVRCVLNKCDSITTQELLRVYGALMWSLGKVIRTPEVLRVYLGSFWDRPYKNQDNAKLFKAETKDLLDDLCSLPRNSSVRKVNELVKRVRLVRAHAYIITHLNSKMPMLFGKDSTKAELIKNLANEFLEIQRLHGLSPGDFPNVERMQADLKLVDFGTFQGVSERIFQDLNQAMTGDLPKLMKALNPPKSATEIPESLNPFPINEWICAEYLEEAKVIFQKAKPNNLGLLSGGNARDPLMEIGTSMDDLRAVWDLCDFEKDGTLDLEEFTLALYLLKEAKQGAGVPESLELVHIPPGKRKKFSPQPAPGTPSKKR